jgi:shikimate kinase
MSQTNRIALVGYRGTGKTTVGQLLASALNWTFVDADSALESGAGRSIAEIFAAEGEGGFRDRESRLLADLCRLDRHVIATGGGVILREVNRNLLRGSAYVAWLTAPAEALWERIQADSATAARRPNLTAAGGLQEVTDLLAAREPLYRAVAAAEFPTAGRSPEQVAGDILAAWRTSSSSR